MKLSELITYKHMVEGLSVKQVYDQLFELLKEVNTNLDIKKFDFDNIKEDIANESRNIEQSLDKIDSGLTQFKAQLSEYFDSIEVPYYEKSTNIYRESLNDTPEYILDRFAFKKLIYDEETADFLKGRIKLYTSYKWSAVEIRPALGEFTDLLTGCDPLYVVDVNDELFRNVKQMWTPEFQRRVRYYTINESLKKPLGVLPQNQIGLILSVDFFNFRPIELIEKYIASMFDTLKPGGMAIFTYNNCDYPIGVDNFEQNYYCYTPGRVVKEICKKYGFRIKASFDQDSNVSWLEIQKPGTMTSLRGGQSLARIESLVK